MKKREAEPREEYDFREGSRGRHHRKLIADGAIVHLDPDLALQFPTSEAVNEALRSIARREKPQER